MLEENEQNVKYENMLNRASQTKESSWNHSFSKRFTTRDLSVVVILWHKMLLTKGECYNLFYKVTIFSTSTFIIAGLDTYHPYNHSKFKAIVAKPSMLETWISARSLGVLI